MKAHVGDWLVIKGTTLHDQRGLITRCIRRTARRRMSWGGSPMAALRLSFQVRTR